MRRGSRARRPGGFGVHAPSVRPDSSLPDLACVTAPVVVIARPAGLRDSPWNAGRRDRQGTELLTKKRGGGPGAASGTGATTGGATGAGGTAGATTSGGMTGAAGASPGAGGNPGAIA